MYEKLDIVTIGEGLVELSSNISLKYAQKFDKYYSGDTLCTAISALRSGSKAGYITKLGTDNFCEYLLEAWGLEGLDTTQVHLCSGQNGVYFIGKNEGKSEFVYYRKNTAATKLSIDDINFDYIKNAKCVYATGFVQSLSLSVREAVREIFKFAKENDILVAYDPNYSSAVTTQEEAREYFDEIKQYIDIMFLNTKSDSVALFDTQSPDLIIQKIHDCAIDICLVREQKTGIHSLNNGSSNFIEYEQSEKIDSTGWEAAFNGAFLSYYLNGRDTIDCVKLANALCILQIKNVGSVKSIPFKEETEKMFGEIYG